MDSRVLQYIERGNLIKSNMRIPDVERGRRRESKKEEKNPHGPCCKNKSVFLRN